MYTEPELKAFLVRAKRATYAGHGAQAQSSRDKSRDLPYEEGDFKYLDSYIGELHFIGEEVVWYRGQPVWGMNYYGTLLEDVPQEFGEFLKSALRQVTSEAPFRGPSNYEEGDFNFVCRWNGGLSFFTGEEEIYYQGTQVYRLVFHGGKLENSDLRI